MTDSSPSDTKSLEASTIDSSTEDDSSEVLSPKPRICVALPQLKYPPITRLDPLGRAVEESPRSLSQVDSDGETNTSFDKLYPPKPVVESPSTNIHFFGGGIPELIPFSIIMDSPKSLFTDSENSSPSPFIDKTTLAQPLPSPNIPKLERKDSRESWTLHTPSEIRMSPLSRATTTPHSTRHQQTKQQTSPFSPHSVSGGQGLFHLPFWVGTDLPLPQAGSAPVTPPPPTGHRSAPITPRVGEPIPVTLSPNTPTTFFSDQKGVTETTMSPATHEVQRLTKKSISDSPSELDGFPKSSPTSSPKNRVNIPLSLRCQSPRNVIVKAVSQVEVETPSKSRISSSKVPLLDSEHHKAFCCCLIA